MSSSPLDALDALGARADERVVVALVREREDDEDLDVEAVAALLGRRGWSAPRAAAAARRAVLSGALYVDCRLALHTAP